MTTLFHSAALRGSANHGWLKANHYFSFASYQNPDNVHFGALRVLNDDWVAPAMGFGEHPHDNMEIITIPFTGSLRHKDSMGNEGVIRPGDVQVMSAGSGVHHSEINGSTTEAVTLFQIWIFTNKKDAEPRYDQKTFGTKDRDNKWQLIVSPDGQAESMWIHQNAFLNLGNFTEGQTVNYKINAAKNGVYLVLISGKATVNGQELNTRDAIGISDTEAFDIIISEKAEFLAIEVPMEF